jgi:hypothetical protein
MYALDHVDLTGAQITANTLSIPDLTSAAPWWTAGESAWNAATSYTIGQYVVRATTGRVYRALATGVDAGLPENTPLRWQDVYPVNARAWADMKTSTYTYADTTYSVTVRPGAISDIDVSGLYGAESVRVEVWDVPGGSLLYDETASTFFWPGDPWVSYYFDLPFERENVEFLAIPASTSSEIRVTFSGAGAMRIGQLAFGRYIELGCAQFGLTMSQRNFGTLEEDDFGNATVKDGLVVVDLSGSDAVDAVDANRVAVFLRKNRNRVMVWRARTDEPIYDYLKTTGIADVSITPQGPTQADMSLKIQGIAA